MNRGLTLELYKIYKEAQIPEFERSYWETEEIIRFQEFVAKGFIYPATKRIYWEIPPKLPGRPLSEYVKEVKQ